MAAFDPKYYGIPPTQQILVENRISYTATSGQTIFPFEYTPGAVVDFYYNGSHLDPRFAFTAADGHNVVLTNPAKLGASVVLESRPSIPVNDVYSKSQTDALAQNYYGIATGTGDVMVVATTPTFTNFVDGMEIKVRIVGGNTISAPTIAFNGLVAKTIVRNPQAILGVGDYAANDEVTFRYLASIDKLVLLQFPQTASVVMDMLNGTMSVSTPSATATFTADRLIVEASSGGLQYLLSGVNKSINLATVGLGGMNTGTAPVSGFVAVYALYNPITKDLGLIAIDCTSIKATPTFTSTGLPNGYTASTLISVWPTSASQLFQVGNQKNRKIYTAYPNLLLTSSTQQPSFVSLSLVGFAPLNAVSWWGNYQVNSIVAGNTATISVAGSASGIGIATNSVFTSAGAIGSSQAFPEIPIITSQQTFYIATVSTTSTTNIQISVSGYQF